MKILLFLMVVGLLFVIEKRSPGTLRGWLTRFRALGPVARAELWVRAQLRT